MSFTPFPLEQVYQQLRQQGFRLTTARRAILQALYQSAVPLTVGSILEKVLEIGEKPNKTTVYREMEFLKQRGVVQELKFEGAEARYFEFIGDHHHHIRCQDCGRISDIELPEEQHQITAEIEKQTKFRVFNHFFEFIGRCPECQRKAEPETTEQPTGELRA